MAYLGFTSLDEIQKMTIKEYRLRMEAYQIKEVNVYKHLALQAWFNQAVQATSGSKKNPKPKYKRFNQFFDAEEEINRVRDAFENTNTSSRRSNLTRNQIIAKRYEEYQELKRKRNAKNKEKKGGK